MDILYASGKTDSWSLKMRLWMYCMPVAKLILVLEDEVMDVLYASGKTDSWSLKMKLWMYCM